MRPELSGDMGMSAVVIGARNLIQDLRREPRLGAVAVGQAVDDGDGLVLTALVQEKLGRLEQMEDEEADDKHGKGDDANRHDKVPPPLLHGPAGDEEPGHQGREQLSDRPPHGQQREQGTGSIGQELHEQGAVDGQVPADAEAQRGEEEAHSAPALGVRRHDAEDAGDEQRHDEGDAAPEKVGADAPDEAAKGETDKEGAGGVADRLLRDAKFTR